MNMPSILSVNAEAGAPIQDVTAEVAAEIIAEQEADHRREMRKLSDIAYVLLEAADGNPLEAERLLDEWLGLLCEGGVLSTWRLRIVLGLIGRGL
jgi:hypothetical protein